MKTGSKIFAAAAMGAGLGVLFAFADVKAQPSSYHQFSEPPEASTVTTMKELRQAENETQRQLKLHPHNNTRYLVKRNHIQGLIDRLQTGEKVDPSEIDHALDPQYIR